jgi:hypothetical protein
MALNALVGALAGPVADLLDKLIPDPAAREEAKRRLLEAEGRQELERMQAQLSAIIAEAKPPQDSYSSMSLIPFGRAICSGK